MSFEKSAYSKWMYYRGIKFVAVIFVISYAYA